MIHDYTPLASSYFSRVRQSFGPPHGAHLPELVLVVPEPVICHGRVGGDKQLTVTVLQLTVKHPLTEHHKQRLTRL